MIAVLFFKLMVTGVGMVAIAYLSICIALLFWQNRLIFVPSPIIEYTPSDLGLVYEDVWLLLSNRVAKPERLHGWWIPTANSGDVLLYLHGNGKNVSANLEHAQRLHQLGFSVFLFDYRGYGRSEGNFPTESGVYRDAQAAWNYLVEQRGIPPENIFLYGHSLGAAIALDLAVRQPQAAGLMMENGFTSMRDMVDHQEIYRFFPTNLILNHRFDSLSKLKLLRVPLLVIHGLEDQIVPPRMGQVLFDAAHVPKKLLLVPAASHNNVASVSGEEYSQAVRDFYQLVRIHQHQTLKH